MTDIALSNFQAKVSIPVAKIRRAAQLACRTLKFEAPDLSIVFVGEQRMRRLNREYLKHDYVTDVITFDHGEIVICPLVAARNAKSHKNPIERELILYVVHGILHLCGHDDHKPSDIARMRQQEQKIMGLIK